MRASRKGECTAPATRADFHERLRQPLHRHSFDRRLRWAGPAVLLAIGLLLILLSNYGLWGLVLVVIGGSLQLRAWLLRHEAAAA